MSKFEEIHTVDEDLQRFQHIFPEFPVNNKISNYSFNILEEMYFSIGKFLTSLKYLPKFWKTCDTDVL